jgi:hypothetical protein
VTRTGRLWPWSAASLGAALLAWHIGEWGLALEAFLLALLVLAAGAWRARG